MYLPENHSFFKGFYTGVGSRTAPLYIMYMLSELSMIFEQKGYILRSGCAFGADAALEDVLLYPQYTSEIYIPNKQYPKNVDTTFKPNYVVPQDKFGNSFDGKYRQAMRLIHDHGIIGKAWRNCKEYIMNFHNASIFQVLGLDLQTRSKFTLAYTPNGEKDPRQTTVNTGGTATAIHTSYVYNINVYNLGDDVDYMRLLIFIVHNKHLINYEKIHTTIPRTHLNKNKLTYSDLLETINKDKKIRLSKIENECK
jgi:hypothetical protein